MLNLPDRIYEKCEDVYNKCRVRSMFVAPLPRVKISDIRASVFADVVFVDHCEIELKKRKKKKYVVLLVWTVERIYCGLRLRIHSIRKKIWYIFENGMNRASLCNANVDLSSSGGVADNCSGFAVSTSNKSGGTLPVATSKGE